MDHILCVIITGAPGCGKGTQSQLLTDRLGFAHVSTGDLLRNVANGANERSIKEEDVIKIKECMNQGLLVPDELVMTVLMAEVQRFVNCGKSFVLDGFPRSIIQAKKLDDILLNHGVKLACVISLDIDEEILLKRIVGRLVHIPSGRTYHVQFNPPKVPMVDDITGEPLIRREDDNPEKLKTRLHEYHEKTSDLLEFYKDRGHLVSVDASKDPEDVFRCIRDKIIELKAE